MSYRLLVTTDDLQETFLDCTDLKHRSQKTRRGVGGLIGGSGGVVAFIAYTLQPESGSC